MVVERRKLPKLTAAQVADIRRSTLRYADLAEQYGVAVGTIKHVRLRTSWKDIA